MGLHLSYIDIIKGLIIPIVVYAYRVEAGISGHPLPPVIVNLSLFRKLHCFAKV